MSKKLLSVFAFLAALCVCFVLFRSGDPAESGTPSDAPRSSGRATAKASPTASAALSTPAASPDFGDWAKPSAIPHAPDQAKLDAFQDWTKRWEKASPAERVALTAEGERLAAARRPEFKALIAADPRRALALSVPRVIRQDLPKEITAHLEKPVSATGDYNVYMGRPAPGQPVPAEGLTLRYFEAEGNSYQARVYGEMVPVLTRKAIPLRGVALDREFAVAESPVRQLEVGERIPAGVTVEDVCPVSGIETAAVSTGEPVAEETPTIEVGERFITLCNGSHVTVLDEKYRVFVQASGPGGAGFYMDAFPGTSSEAIGNFRCLYIRITYPDQMTQPNTEDQAMNDMKDVARYYREVSYGKLSVTTTVTPLIVLPQTLAWYQAKDAEVDGLGVIHNQARAEARKLGYDSSQFNCIIVRVNGGLRSGSSWGGGDSVWAGWNGMDVLNHECGHSLGINHANYWNTTDGTAYGTGANQEYGNPYDVMGGSGGFSAHYNTITKRMLNWLPANYYHAPKLNGVYRIYAYDQPTLEEGKRYAITVAKDSVRQYNIEYHPARGGFLDDSALVLYSGMGSNAGHLLDTTPGSLAGKGDAGIAVGRTYSDFEADMHFTVLSKNNTTPPSLDVSYQRGPFPGNVAPTATFSASATTVNPGDSVTFTATATDANSDALAYHWEFSDGVAGDGSSAFTRVFVLPSQVTASLTVSDMKGGSIRRSTVINVGSHGKQTVTGTITLAGQPLPGVYVSGAGLGTWTNVDGTYSLAGVSTGSQTISASLAGHTFTAGFTNPLTVVAGANTANWTATASPFVSLASISDANEGGANGTFRLTRTGDTTSSLTVLVSPVSGTATRTTDYTFTPDYTASGSFFSFTIPAAAASLDVSVAAVNDAAAEGPETISLQLASAAGYFSGSANAIVMSLNDNDTSLPQVSVTAPDPYALENPADNGTFTFSRTGSTAAALNLTVAWSGTATNGTDYTTLSNTVTIPSGSASTTVTVTPTNDSAAEVPETVVATISTNAAYVIATGGANTSTVTLTDDDTPFVSVSVLDGSASEAGPDSGVFLITRTGPTTSTLKVYYGISGSALHGTDYGMLSGEVTIPAGSASAPVVVFPVDDDIAEQPENVTLAVTTFNNAYSVASDFQASVSIADNSDVPLVSVRAGSTGVEGSSSATFVFRAIGTTAGNVTVTYNLSGTATPGTDYTAPSGSVTIPANGTNEVTVTLPVTDDALAEGTESIRAQIVSSPNYRAYNDGSAETAIRDNDSGADRVSVSAYHDNPAEASSVQGRFYFSRTGTTGAMLVNYAVSGTATNGTDYANLTGNALIPDGQSGVNLPFVPVDDALLEGTESVTITVVSGTGYSPDRPSSATLYITDNETSASTLSFQATGSATGESPAVLGEYRDIAVTLSPASASTVSVSYTSGGGTALGDDVDWTFADASNGNTAIPGGTLTFAPGVTSQNIRVRVKNDLVREPTEYAVLRLVNPVNATLTARYQHNLFIYDELPAGLVTEERWNTGTVYTNNTWNTVSPDYTGFLDGFTSAQDVADNYSRRLTGLITAPTTGSYTFWIASDDASKLFISTDATAANKVQRATLATWTTFQNWTANASQQSVALTLTAGQSYYVEVQHQEGGGGDHVSVAWQGPGFSRTPILNSLPDNAPRYVRFAIEATTRLETDGAEPLLIAVLDRPAGATAVTVNYAATGTATSGTDYTLTPGTITFNPGEIFKAVPLALLTDALGESPESIIVSLSSPVGASLSAPSSHLITLVDPAMPVVGTVFASANSSQAVNTVISTMTASVTSPRVVSSWSIVAGNPNNAFAINASGQITLALPASLPNPGNIQLVVRATDDLGSSGDGAANIVCNAVSNQFVSEQRWAGTTAFWDEDWSATPVYSDTLSTLTSAQGIGDNFSRRLTGYLKPAVTGTYYFWTASDDQSRLYLGTDGYESSKVLIASVGDYTSFQQWDKEANQISVGIPLVAGQTYWIEAQHAEGGGGDHVSVAWQGPGIPRQAIPSSVMGAFVGGAPVGEPGPQAAVPVVSITSPANNANFLSTNNITVTADVTANGQTIGAVEFYRDNILIGTDTAAPYEATYLNATTAASVNLTARALYLDTFATSPSVNIVVVNANPPTVATKYFGANSGMAVNTTLGTVTASVFSGRTVSSWSIVSGNTGNLFGINNSGQVSLLLPGSLPASAMVYLTVRATDSAGYSGDGTVGLFCNSVGSSVWVNANGGSWPTTANWSNNTAVFGISSTADFAVLDLTSNAAVTLDGARTVGNLVFGDSTPSHNWTLSTGSAGPLTLNTTTGNPVVTVNNQTATLNLVVAGTKGLIKNGAGTLALGGINTFTGGLTVNAGTVSLQPGDYNSALPTSSAVTINNGGTVLQVNTNVTNNSIAFTVNAGGTLNFASYHAHLAAITLNGGTLLGTGSGKYAGEDFLLNGNVTVGGSSASTINVANGIGFASRTFTVADATASSAADLTVSGAGAIKGAGLLTKAGAGTMVLANANTYSGGTTVSAGTLLATNSSGSATGTGAVTVATAGSLGGTGTISGAVTVNGGLVPGVNGVGTLTVSNTVTLASTTTTSMQLAKAGVVLSNDSVQGVTTLTCAGTLTVTASGDALTSGNSFALFGATSFSGTFSAVNLPSLGFGLNWNTSQLYTTGTIFVESGLTGQSITFNTLSAKAFGDAAFALTATASSGLPVSYSSSDEAVATISGSTVTIVGVGSTTITATQAGDTTYAAAIPVDQVLTVSQGSQSISFGALAARSFGDTPFVLTGTASSGLAVSYASSNTGVATVSGSTVTIVGAGSATITASQSGDANWLAATPVPQVLSVNQVNQVITFGPLADKTYGDAPFALTGTSTSGLTLTYASSDPAVATVSGSTVTLVGSGSTTITASQAGNTNYTAATPVPQVLTVNPPSYSTLYFDLNGATAGSGTPGAATWTSGNNWSTDAAGLTATQSWLNVPNVVFSAGTEAAGTWTVTLAGTVSTNSLTFNGAANTLHTLTGGTINSGAGGLTLTATAAGTVSGRSKTIASALTGTGGVTIAANGDTSDTGNGSNTVFTLSGANTFTGGVTITSGVVGTVSNFGDAANVVTLNGGGLVGIATGTFSRSIVAGTNGGYLRTYGAATLTHTGVLSGSGTLRRTDGGTFIAAGSNTFSGILNNQVGTFAVTGTNTGAATYNINAGTLNLGNNGATGSLGGSSTVNIVNSGTLRISRSDNTSFSSLTPAPSFSTASSRVEIALPTQAATLNLDSDIGSSSTVGIIRFSGGTTTLASGTDLVSDTFSVGLQSGTNVGIVNIGTGSTVTARFFNLGETTSNSGIVNQTGGSVTALSGGLGFRLAHWNHNTNPSSHYNLTGGTLDATALSANAAANAKVVNIGWDGLGAMVVGGGSGSATLKAWGIQLDANGDSVTYANTLTVSTNGIVEVGAGNLASASANDKLILNGGTLRSTATNTLASATTANTATNSVLDVNTGFTSTFSGVISGSGALTKSGPGIQLLSGTNTFTGGVTVTDGTLRASSASGLGTGAVAVTGGVFDLNGQTFTLASTVGSAGTLSGTGGLGATTLNGILTPGGSSSGLVTLSSATVGSTANLSFQLAATGTRGTNYDALTVSSALALDGTVTVTLNGLTPALGQSFDLINSTGAIDVSAFNVASDLVLPALAPTLAWNTSAFASTGVISIVSGLPTFPASPIADSATEDSAFAGQLAANDASPNETLSFTKQSGPAWLTVSTIGALSGTPLNANVGLNSFVVRVTDSAGQFAEATLNVTVANTNDAPAFAANPINLNATEDAAFTGQLSASDVDAGETATLVFAKVSGPSWLTVSTTGALSGTPTNSEVGANSFTVSVGDGIAPAVTATLNLTVANTNDAPAFAADPINLNATEDAAFTGQLSASDVDAGETATLVFAKVSGPTWLTVSTTGALSGTPTNSEVGANSFTVSVSDGIAPAVTATLNLTVANTNDAPAFAANPISLNGTEDTAFTGQLSASDVDAGETASLVFAKVSGPSWLAVSTTGALSGTPTNSEVGANTFTVSVSDGIAPAVNASLVITVNPVNDAPAFAADPINGSSTGGSAFTGQLSASDVDVGDVLSFSKQSGPAWLVVSSTGALSGTPSNAEAGLNAFTVAVSDGTATVTATLNVTVTASGPSFAAFTSAHFSPAEQADPLISGPDADPDHDGVSNLLEYAFSMDPKVPSIANLPQTITVPVSADTFVGVTYTRLKDATDLTFTPEFSGIPETAGFTASAFVQINLVDNGNGTETVTLRDTTAVTSGTPRFVRLRIEQN